MKASAGQYPNRKIKYTKPKPRRGEIKKIIN